MEMKREMKPTGYLDVVGVDGAYVGPRETCQSGEPQSGLPEGIEVLGENAVERTMTTLPPPSEPERLPQRVR
jgi:hypothetical protein